MKFKKAIGRKRSVFSFVSVEESPEFSYINIHLEELVQEMVL